MIVSRRPAHLILSLLLLLSLSASVLGAQEHAIDRKPNSETARQRAASAQTQVTTGQEASPSKEQLASETVSTDAVRKASLIDLIASRPLVKGKATLAPVGPQAGSSDKWEFTFTPYVLLGSLKGEVGQGTRIANVDAKFSEIIKEFNFGFMARFDARKNRFIFFNDLLYLNLADTIETPGPLFSSIRADLKTLMLQPTVGYRLIAGEGGSLDLFGGIRYWHLSTNVEFRAGVLPAATIDLNQNWVDAIGGLKARGRLSEKWYVLGYGDLGGGGSEFTYQLFGGVGVNLNRVMSFIVGYRYLHVDYRKDGFVYDTGLRGPVIGGGFRF